MTLPHHILIIMSKKEPTLLFLIALLFFMPIAVQAQNWDDIRNSDDYYYGVGHGETDEESQKAAMAELTGMIATNVSNEFSGLFENTSKGDKTEYKSKVLNCVRTYSQATLTNVQKWKVDGSTTHEIRYYIKRSELEKIYESRIQRANEYVGIAEEALAATKIDLALQYYYWAYSLVRSLQRPSSAIGTNGKKLINWLPARIRDIMSDVSVKYVSRDGDRVGLHFFYKGKPVSSIHYSYSDGRTDCIGDAKDGVGIMDMAPDYETDVYHLSLEYEFKNETRGDTELESVLAVIPHKVFASSEIKITPTPAKDGKEEKNKEAKTDDKVEVADKNPGINIKADEDAITKDAGVYTEILNRVMGAIRSHNYNSVDNAFTISGLERYKHLIKYGMAQVIGTPSFVFFKSFDGHVTARGVQMSFAFKGKVKKTFVEDVVFSFNTDKRIDNITFGLGSIATNDIMLKETSWKEGTKEMLVEFLENYKTAYCMKDMQYITNVFADDAVIIVGHVAKPRTGRSAVSDGYNERQISVEGQSLIQYNRYTKNQYLANLRNAFLQNEFINIKFTQNDIQWLEKYEDRQLFGIQIGQEYSSSRYSDKGYLFLLVDMTNSNEPTIKVRTWQPNMVDTSKIYNAGDFYE